MSFTIENQEPCTQLRFSGTTCDASHVETLAKTMSELGDVHLIVDFLSVNEFGAIEAMQQLMEARMGQGLTCVYIVQEVLLGQFDDTLAFVPTQIEATDWYDMEDLQRQLLDS